MSAKKRSAPVRMARWLGKNWARVSYARHVEPVWLERTHTPIPIFRLPAAFHGLRVAQLSDIHCGDQIPQTYLDEVIRTTQEAQPDLIALTGDFIHKGYRHVEQAARLVGQLRAPLGVFAVLGNHDFSVRNALGWRRYPALHQHVADALQANGVQVLRNQSIPIERGGERVYVCGLDDLWSRECDPTKALAHLDSELPRIVLAHNPQTIETIGAQRCDLMLSGHTHGGQIDWPGLGRIVLGKKAKRFAAGLYVHEGRHLYVHRGVGFGFKFRFQVRPEVAILTLVNAESAAGSGQVEPSS